jgi:hypothetical protein
MSTILPLVGWCRCICTTPPHHGSNPRYHIKLHCLLFIDVDDDEKTLKIVKYLRKPIEIPGPFIALD